MKIITVVIRQPRLPILCEEDKMDDHLCEGKGHECRPARAYRMLPLRGCDWISLTG